MRSTTGGEDTVLQGANYATHARVYVEDADGTYQNLSNLDSLDWVHSGSISQDVNQIVPTAELQVWRDQEGGQSLAPLDEDSTLNRNAAEAYAPLIDVGRGLRIDFATVAHGSSPVAGDWKRVFDGVIDSWDCAKSLIRIQARDTIGAELADTMIEEEEDLGSEAGVPVQDVMQAILDRWTEDPISLYTPTDPGFVITPYRQQRESVLEALQALAALIGWVIEPRWHDGTSAFRLTFYEPDRTPASTDWTWGAGRYSTVSEFRLSRVDVRNAVSLWYTDSTGARVQYTVEDSASIGKYGRQWMEFDESSDSPIDTAAEAQDMADNALLDLKDPKATGAYEAFAFWRRHRLPPRVRWRPRRHRPVHARQTRRVHDAVAQAWRPRPGGGGAPGALQCPHPVRHAELDAGYHPVGPQLARLPGLVLHERVDGADCRE
jgi:hypothetical protein